VSGRSRRRGGNVDLLLFLLLLRFVHSPPGLPQGLLQAPLLAQGAVLPGVGPRSDQVWQVTCGVRNENITRKCMASPGRVWWKAGSTGRGGFGGWGVEGWGGGGARLGNPMAPGVL